MSKNIAKSPEMLRREAEIKDLRAQLKKRQTTLKSLKTRLKNTQSDIEDIQRKVQSQMLRKAEEADALRLEITELAKQMKKVKGMSKMEKEQLLMMADELSKEEMFGPGFQDYKNWKAQQQSGNFNFDEYERARMHDVFEQFQVKPEEKEQRDIRKVFLKLSQKFHPDLAKGEKESEDFHSLMQQINEAYQNNDIQTLLELESLYLTEEVDFSTKAVTVDVLQQEIDRLKRDLGFIDQQIERTSEEIKNLRQSEMGAMLTSINKLEREGEGFDTMTAHFDQMIHMFTQLRDGLKDSIQLGRISPKLMDLIMGQEDDFEDDEDDFPAGANPLDMLMQLMENDENLMDLFGDLEDEEVDEIENPKFPIGSSVRLKGNEGSPFDKKVKMKGWQGRVESAFYNEKNQPVYRISFDSVTIGEMPAKLIADAVSQGMDFQDLEIREHLLEACSPRDQETDSISAYRKNYHQHAWEYLRNPAQAKRLQNILLMHPSLADEENWTEHFLSHLKFPFDAKIRGAMDSQPGIAVQVFGFQLYDEEYGHIVEIKVKGERGKRGYPLLDLRAANSRSPLATMLDDYFEWVQEILVM